jgi:hypothetical protein
VPQDAPANAQDKTPVPFHDRREGGLVVACDIPAEQLPVGKLSGLSRGHRSLDVAEDVIKLSVAHH